MKDEPEDSVSKMEPKAEKQMIKNLFPKFDNNFFLWWFYDSQCEPFFSPK